MKEGRSFQINEGIDGCGDGRVEWAAGSYGHCATIGIGIESNGINGADRFFRLLTDYAGIANCPFLDLDRGCGAVRGWSVPAVTRYPSAEQPLDDTYRFVPKRRQSGQLEPGAADGDAGPCNRQPEEK